MLASNAFSVEGKFLLDFLFVQSLFDEGVCPDTPETLTKIGAEIGLEAEVVKNVISTDDNVKNVRKRAAEWTTVGVAGAMAKQKEN